MAENLKDYRYLPNEAVERKLRHYGNLSIEESHARMVDYYPQINGLFFGKPPTAKRPPRLVYYQAALDEANLSNISRTLKIHPEYKCDQERSRFVDNFLDLGMMTDSAAYYDPFVNAIAMNTNQIPGGIKSYKWHIIHETAHAVKLIDYSKFHLSFYDLSNINYTRANGDTVQTKWAQYITPLIKSYAPGSAYTKYSVNINEFFPPIAERFLKSSGSDLPAPLLESEYAANSSPKKQSELDEEIKDIVYYLPRVAAEILLAVYGGDAEALLWNNPDIPYLDVYQLWEKYCIPLLKNGEF